MVIKLDTSAPDTANTEESEEARDARHHLRQAVAETEEGHQTSLPSEISKALGAAVTKASYPELQILVAMASRKVALSTVPAGALQGRDGADIRSVAAKQVGELVELFDRAGSKVRLSKDPGVSNQFRVEQLDDAWLAKRKSKDQAKLMMKSAEALDSLGSTTQRMDALRVVMAAVWDRARAGAIDYPITARPRLGPLLEAIRGFRQGGSGGVRSECIAGALARAVMAPLLGCDEVRLTLVNADSPFDGVLVREAQAVAMLEVSDVPLSIEKLRHEVLRGMHEVDVLQAFVFAPLPVASDLERQRLEEFVDDQYLRHDRRIELCDLDDALTYWLRLGHADDRVLRGFLEEVGVLLDSNGRDLDRAEWRGLLVAFFD